MTPIPRPFFLQENDVGMRVKVMLVQYVMVKQSRITLVKARFLQSRILTAVSSDSTNCIYVCTVHPVLFPNQVELAMGTSLLQALYHTCHDPPLHWLDELLGFSLHG